MKTVAFAGDYPVLSKLLVKYMDGPVFDSKLRTMANGEQLKVLKRKNPRTSVDNEYQWTRNAERIFVCVDANHPDFMRHLYEETMAGRFETEKVTLVGVAQKLDPIVLADFQNYAIAHNYPMIYCSLESNDAHYTIGENTFFQDLKSTFDMAADVVVNINEAQMEETSEPEEDNERTRDKIRRFFRK